jgi:DNA-binding NtrC family response regulator
MVETLQRAGMRPSVLIIEDSPSTADLARLSLLDVPCDVEVAANPSSALDLLYTRLSPWVMVVDSYLPGVQPQVLLADLHSAAPRAAFVLLLDRGVHSPMLPVLTVQLAKPLQPRRFASVVTELLYDHEHQDDGLHA